MNEYIEALLFLFCWIFCDYEILNKELVFFYVKPNVYSHCIERRTLYLPHCSGTSKLALAVTGLNVSWNTFYLNLDFYLQGNAIAVPRIRPQLLFLPTYISSL